MNVKKSFFKILSSVLTVFVLSSSFSFSVLAIGTDKYCETPFYEEYGNITVAGGELNYWINNYENQAVKYNASDLIIKRPYFFPGLTTKTFSNNIPEGSKTYSSIYMLGEKTYLRKTGTVVFDIGNEDFNNYYKVMIYNENKEIEVYEDEDFEPNTITINVDTTGYYFMIVKSDAMDLKGLKLLRYKFPAGAYWNHVAGYDHCYDTHGTTDLGSCNNPDGYTWSPCETHSGFASFGQCDCNTFLGHLQCYGFAVKCAYDVYGQNPFDWYKYYSVDSVKPGDVIRYSGWNTDPYWGHTVFVTGRSGNTIQVAEANWTDKCQISYGREINLNEIYIIEAFSAPYEATY